VFAPYFQAYNDDDAAVLSRRSGASYLTMAFIQTEAPDPAPRCGTAIRASRSVCSPTRSRDPGGRRRRGPSFGGFTADDTGTELADSCTDVHAIAGSTNACWIRTR